MRQNVVVEKSIIHFGVREFDRPPGSESGGKPPHSMARFPIGRRGDGKS
jgi:hypothetical protein